MLALLNLFIEKIIELFLIIVSLFSFLFNTFIPQAKDFIIESFRNNGDIVENIREIDYRGILDIEDNPVINTEPQVSPVQTDQHKELPVTNPVTNNNPSQTIISEPGNNTIDPESEPSTQDQPLSHLLNQSEIINLDGNMNNIADVSINIICLETRGALTTASTGSGVIVSPKGVVLTNAHVAQLLLLESSGYDIECSLYQTTINYGYKADIMYLSPDWIYENADTISHPNPKGTGEHDYALLLITGTTDKNKTVPASFPYSRIELNKKIPEVDLPITISGFPGGPLNVYDLRKAGNLRIDNSRIREVYSFNYRDVELFTTERSFVAARGASGGGIFSNNSLIGITVTITPEGVGNKINAITTSHINSSIKESSGKDLIEILSKDPYIILNEFRSNYLINLSTILRNQL